MPSHLLQFARNRRPTPRFNYMWIIKVNRDDPTQSCWLWNRGWIDYIDLLHMLSDPNGIFALYVSYVPPFFSPVAPNEPVFLTVFERRTTDVSAQKKHYFKVRSEDIRSLIQRHEAVMPLKRHTVVEFNWKKEGF